MQKIIVSQMKVWKIRTKIGSYHIGNQFMDMIVADYIHSDTNASQHEVELLFFFSAIEEKALDIQ